VLAFAGHEGRELALLLGGEQEVNGVLHVAGIHEPRVRQPGDAEPGGPQQRAGVALLPDLQLQRVGARGLARDVDGDPIIQARGRDAGALPLGHHRSRIVEHARMPVPCALITRQGARGELRTHFGGEQSVQAFGIGHHGRIAALECPSGGDSPRPQELEIREVTALLGCRDCDISLDLGALAHLAADVGEPALARYQIFELHGEPMSSRLDREAEQHHLAEIIAR
jgi:hypothetical protein